MQEPAKTKHFRFSLRLLLFAFVLLSCGGAWVAYQIRWIQQRHAVLDDRQVMVSLEDDIYIDGPPKAPWPLWLFGEERFEPAYLWLPDKVTQEKVARVQALFPETKVQRSSDRDSPFDL